jgi:hypothetical protein
LAEALQLSEDERTHLAKLAAMTSAPELCPAPGVLASEVRPTIVQLLHSVDPTPAFVMGPLNDILAPGVEACQYRNAMRDPVEQFAFDGYDQLDADMKRDLSDDGWWFDTAALTPEQTAEKLVREVSERARTLGELAAIPEFAIRWDRARAEKRRAKRLSGPG